MDRIGPTPRLGTNHTERSDDLGGATELQVVAKSTISIFNEVPLVQR